MRTIPLLAFVAACGGGASTPAANSADILTVLYSARLDGEIEPCG